MGAQNAMVRNKLVSLITLDVHNRDVLQEMVRMRIQSANDFKWQSQLRYYFMVPGMLGFCLPCITVADALDYFPKHASFFPAHSGISVSGGVSGRHCSHV
jgi:hypothetical protein